MKVPLKFNLVDVIKDYIKDIDYRLHILGGALIGAVEGGLTATTGLVNTRVFLSSVQGDSWYADSLLLNGVKFSGPFKPINDFMNAKYVDYTGTALQTVGSLLPQNLSQYGYYTDQTICITNFKTEVNYTI